jgi:hypothetical protein
MIAIAAALVTQPVRASVIDNLVITENSSTSLTATLNGNPLSVTFRQPVWDIAVAGISTSSDNTMGGVAGLIGAGRCGLY